MGFEYAVIVIVGCVETRTFGYNWITATLIVGAIFWTLILKTWCMGATRAISDETMWYGMVPE